MVGVGALLPIYTSVLVLAGCAICLYVDHMWETRKRISLFCAGLQGVAYIDRYETIFGVRFVSYSFLPQSGERPISCTRRLFSGGAECSVGDLVTVYYLEDEPWYSILGPHLEYQDPKMSPETLLGSFFL